MTITIDFKADQEARLRRDAAREGVSARDFVGRLLERYLAQSRVHVNQSESALLQRIGLGLSEDPTLGIVGLTREGEDEVVTVGQAKGHFDAFTVAQATTASRLVVIDLTASERRHAGQLLRQSSGLSLADCSTVVCARQRSLTLLIEDQRARRIAKAEGVHCVGIQMLPLHGYVRRKLAYPAATQWTSRIGRAMRTDPIVLSALLSAIDEIAQLRGEREAGQS